MGLLKTISLALRRFNTHTHTHYGLHHRLGRTASLMDAEMGKKPNSGCADFVAPIARPCRADVDDDLALGVLFQDNVIVDSHVQYSNNITLSSLLDKAGTNAHKKSFVCVLCINSSNVFKN